MNDLDCYVANFWRALRYAPKKLAKEADSPVTESDLVARNNALLEDQGLREKLVADPLYYDIRIAAWWVWGVGASIAGHFARNPRKKMLPRITPEGVHRIRPGRRNFEGYESLGEWMMELSQRLRHVTVACGDWRRILTPAGTVNSSATIRKKGVVGVFLDPPYLSDRANVYRVDSYSVGHEVREWALEHGDDPRYRIALCGYHGEHSMPKSWKVFRWKAAGGYAFLGQGKGRTNRNLETIWFSPHCLEEVKEQAGKPPRKK